MFKDLKEVLGENGKLPSYPVFEEGVRRAPKRTAHLSRAQKRLALKNALRYIPAE